MEFEIFILANEKDNKTDKGEVFEKIVSMIFKSQRYEIIERVNFTGSEIDLLCKHIDRNESAFVECKARDALSSTDIKKFVFDVQYRNQNYGFFLYTKSFQHQAAGLIEELKKEDKYKNIYFWNAEKCIKLLHDSNEIRLYQNKDFDKYSITKLIVFYSYFGIFQILILSDSTIPSYYTVLTKNGEPVEASKVSTLTEYYDEIKSLQFYNGSDDTTYESVKKTSEVVVENQESDFWYDYKPASMNHFVGRIKITDSIIDFFYLVYSKHTDKRIFYIQGKSGWGKSSIVNYIKGKTLNKMNKNKFYCCAFDTRSAETETYISLALLKGIEKAIQDKFISYNIDDIKFTSKYDLLQSENIKTLLATLERNNKYIVLIFDQFEDVFRKKGLAKAFYKLLFDVHDIRSNIILGFSWKSEINIPIDHDAYYLWQQSKDYVYEFETTEFAYSESESIIRQLEKEIRTKLPIDFKRKIIDSSQGFPWLVKKLCIHILNQITNGQKIDELLENNLNIERIFIDDLENLSKKEIDTLNYIAKRAYENNALDIVDLDEKVTEKNIIELINKRLVIKSGTKYNIYWDVFRDYLVTKDIPVIGETYLIRQSVSPVISLYFSLQKNKKYLITDIQKIISVTEGTALNLLRELINIGLIEYNNKRYFLSKKVFANETEIIKYLNVKLSKHTLYLFISRNDENITFTDLIETFKDLFKSSTDYNTKTIETYIRVLLNWFSYAKLDISNISKDLELEVKKLSSFTPQNMPDALIDFFKTLEKEYDPANVIVTKYLYDLKNLGLLNFTRGRIVLTPLGVKAKKKETDLLYIVINEAIKTEKIHKAYEIISENTTIKKKEFKDNIEHLLADINSDVYKIRVFSILFNWGKFIFNNKDFIQD